MAFESLFSKLFQELHHSLLCPVSVGVLTIFHHFFLFSFHLLFSVKAHPFPLPPPDPSPPSSPVLLIPHPFFFPCSCLLHLFFLLLCLALLPPTTFYRPFPRITSPSCHFAPLPLFPGSSLSSALGATFGFQAGGFCLSFLRHLDPFRVCSSLCHVATPSLKAEPDKRKYQRLRWADSLLP